MYTREKYLEIIRQLEAQSCEGDLNKAKEFFAAEDFEAIHRIVVWNQEWLRDLGIISEQLSGVGETWHSNGHLESRGTYIDGKRHGALKWFYSNGQLESICTLVDGKRQGVWEWFYSNGKLRLRGTYVNGENHGVWEWFKMNGKLWMRGTFEHGVLIKKETF